MHGFQEKFVMWEYGHWRQTNKDWTSCPVHAFYFLSVRSWQNTLAEGFLWICCDTVLMTRVWGLFLNAIKLQELRRWKGCLKWFCWFWTCRDRIMDVMLIKLWGTKSSWQVLLNVPLDELLTLTVSMSLYSLYMYWQLWEEQWHHHYCWHLLT